MRPAVHVIRFLGIFPEFNPHRAPANLGPGSLPIKHPIAKRILDESGLPVTYITSSASFIENLWLQIQTVRLHKEFNWPEHRVLFIDPRDVAEVPGRLFLLDNARHIRAFHAMNNDYDWLTFEEVAVILSEESGESITFDGSYERFIEFWGPRMGKRRSDLEIPSDLNSQMRSNGL